MAIVCPGFNNWGRFISSSHARPTDHFPAGELIFRKDIKYKKKKKTRAKCGTYTPGSAAEEMVEAAYYGVEREQRRGMCSLSPTNIPSTSGIAKRGNGIAIV